MFWRSHSRSNSSKSLQTAELSFTPHSFDSPQRSIASSSEASSDLLTFDRSHISKIRVLEAKLVKFRHYKKFNLKKTNILRVHLLRYLRKPPSLVSNYDSDQDTIADMLSVSLVDLDLNLIFAICHCIAEWWQELLSIVSHEFNFIPNIDKSCYLECLSRLTSHLIWPFITHHKLASEKFASQYTQFKQLLSETFKLCMTKLAPKSPQFDIISGKVFALAFFHLDNTFHGLTFLLKVKLKTYKSIYKLCFMDNKHDLSQLQNDLLSQYPSELHPLIKNVLPRKANYYPIESKLMNAMTPPTVKIDAIDNTKGPWSIKWSSLENVNVFCSFLRHYFNLNSIYLRNLTNLIIDEYYVYSSPGFLYMFSHIYEILEMEIFIKLNTMNKKNSQQKAYNSDFNSNQLLFIQPTLSESSSDKILNVFTDLIDHPRSFECLLLTGIIKGYDNLLKLFIKSTAILNQNKCQVVFTMFTFFVKAVKNASLLNIDWEFWVNTFILLLNSDNLQNELRSLVTIFDLWQLIPSSYHTVTDHEWMKKENKRNLKSNLTDYLLDDVQWNKFFGHYNPLIREWYIKLIIWKILGYQSMNIGVTSPNGKWKNNSINLLVESKLLNLFQLTNRVKFNHIDPIVNKKFVIIESPGSSPVSSHSLFSLASSPVYPFEVLDEHYLTRPEQLSSSVNSSPSLDPSSPKRKLKSNSQSSMRLQEFFSKPKLFGTPINRSQSNNSLNSYDDSQDSTFHGNNEDDFVPPPELLNSSSRTLNHITQFEFSLANNELSINSFLSNLESLNVNRYSAIDWQAQLLTNNVPSLPSLPSNISFRSSNASNGLASSTDGGGTKFGDLLPQFDDDDFEGDLDITINGSQYDLLTTPTANRFDLPITPPVTSPTRTQSAEKTLCLSDLGTSTVSCEFTGSKLRHFALAIYQFEQNKYEFEDFMVKSLSSVSEDDVLSNGEDDHGYQLTQEGVNTLINRIPGIGSIGLSS